MNHALSFLAERRRALRHFYRIGSPRPCVNAFHRLAVEALTFLLLNQKGTVALSDRYRSPKNFHEDDCRRLGYSPVWGFPDNLKTQIPQSSHSFFSVHAANRALGTQLYSETNSCGIEECRQPSSATLWMNDQPIDGSYGSE
jgi:hypothetical protein